jgi:hypothetical protein
MNQTCSRRQQSVEDIDDDSIIPSTTAYRHDQHHHHLDQQLSRSSSNSHLGADTATTTALTYNGPFSDCGPPPVTSDDGSSVCSPSFVSRLDSSLFSSPSHSTSTSWRTDDNLCESTFGRPRTPHPYTWARDEHPPFYDEDAFAFISGSKHECLSDTGDSVRTPSENSSLPHRLGAHPSIRVFAEDTAHAAQQELELVERYEHADEDEEYCIKETVVTWPEAIGGPSDLLARANQATYDRQRAKLPHLRHVPSFVSERLRSSSLGKLVRTGSQSPPPLPVHATNTQVARTQPPHQKQLLGVRRSFNSTHHLAHSWTTSFGSSSNNTTRSTTASGIALFRSIGLSSGRRNTSQGVALHSIPGIFGPAAHPHLPPDSHHHYTSERH